MKSKEKIWRGKQKQYIYYVYFVARNEKMQSELEKPWVINENRKQNYWELIVAAVKMVNEKRDHIPNLNIIFFYYVFIYLSHEKAWKERRQQEKQQQ